MLPIKDLERVYPRPQVVERPPGPWAEYHEPQRSGVVEIVAIMLAVWVCMFALAVGLIDVKTERVPTEQPTNEELYLGEDGQP